MVGILLHYWIQNTELTTEIVSWRRSYGKSGILDLFLQVLKDDDAAEQLKVQALRIVGNSCADTDENRAMLVEDNRLSYISKHLQNPNLFQFVVPVLYNTMVDYGKSRYYNA